MFARTVANLIRSLLLAIAIAFLLWVRFDGSKVRTAEHPVIAAFLASGASVEEVTTDGWALVAKEFLDFTSLKTIESRVAQRLGLDPERLEWSASDGGSDSTGRADTDAARARGYRELTARALRLDGARVDIVGQSLPSLDHGFRRYSAETYLTVRVTRIGAKALDDTSLEVKRMRAALAAASGRGAATAMVYVMVSGRALMETACGITDPAASTSTSTSAFATASSASASASMADLNRRAVSMLRAVGAKDIDWMVDRNLVSVTAFTPRIPERFTLGGRDINLNLALRHDATNGQIHVTVGSPIISEEY